VTQSRGEIKLQNLKGDSNELERVFAFDNVFDTTAQQEQVYQDTALPIVESVLDG
jgi:kinesin family protein 3/17